MGTTKIRSGIKGFLWETIMLIFCILVIWIWTGSFLTSLGMNCVIYIFKVIGLGIYDWVWENKIKWGRK